MIESLLNAFRAPDIRRRILFVAGILIVFRFLSHVPVPGANAASLSTLFSGNQLLGLLDLFSGGGLSRFSIVGLGVNPYINASIIIQLMTGVIPRLQ
jgi:preprotein translocase subunit SecY